MDAVRPEVDILLARQIAAAPLLVLRRPLLFEANDHVGTEPLGRFTQQPLQGFGEISRGNPLEVKPRNELLDSFAPAQVRRQDRRAELHPPALGRRIIPYPRLPHLQGAAPVTIVRAAWCPLRTTKRLPAASRRSWCCWRNSCTSASMACCRICCAPRRTTTSRR